MGGSCTAAAGGGGGVGSRLVKGEGALEEGSSTRFVD
jgi:hypothetical protein